MFVFFGFMLLWVFRPGGSKVQDEAARQIFRNEDFPKDAPPRGPEARLDTATRQTSGAKD
jgi:hypothetical protein